MRNPVIDSLEEIRENTGNAETTGLSWEQVRGFLEADADLPAVVEEALTRHRQLRGQNPELLALDESSLCEAVQLGVLNFYPETGRSPYVPLAARGPWVVTIHGALLYDAGGYGMLGLGHNPIELQEALKQATVMANVMTPSISHARFVDRLQSEIGHTRGGCPYERFAFLNSGSEAVSFAMRLSDVNAHRRVGPGRSTRVVSLEDGFHGRTYRPARISHSTRGAYRSSLASFQQANELVAVPPDSPGPLSEAFEQAERDGAFIEAVVLEPVLGEGPAGLPLSRGVYDAARKLTREHGSLLIIDSIQAGLRAHGCLSIVDYPGFTECAPPDIETWSKALNAGQFPLSVIGLTEQAASLYVTGIYGNTMTGNPRAMEIGCAVLDAITPATRANVRERGEELLAGLRVVAERPGGGVGRIIGTGLMACAELDRQRFPVTGAEGVEQRCRRKGVVAIHAGENGMRYTPHLRMASAEVALVIDVFREVLDEMDGLTTRPTHKPAVDTEPSASEIR